MCVIILLLDIFYNYVNLSIGRCNSLQVVDVKPLWMCFIMFLCCVLWQMLLPYALVEDAKSLIRAICFVADVVTTVAPCSWLRFVDDTFVIQKAEHSQQLLQHINT